MQAMHDEAPIMNNTLPLTVSEDSSHHILPNMNAAYENRFDEVLAFHVLDDDGFKVAPVYLDGKAWHIDTNGFAIYTCRFDRTFGFYCGAAAAILNNDWFHIDRNGSPLYSERYTFVGNYQNNLAMVCDKDGFYFHITKQGARLYVNKWRYCGDYRDGIAVVQAENGLSTHINVHGEFSTNKWFLDLDVFHKGFARAKDKSGWHHIDKVGQHVYPQRYASVEPFYNGCARVEKQNGELLIIDERGNPIRILRNADNDEFSSLSANLVGYWTTFAIASAVELNIFEYLPNNVESIAVKTKTNKNKLQRLLNGLAEIQLIELHNDEWKILPKGEYLSYSHPMTLSTASLEYKGELLSRWFDLTALIRGEVKQDDIFKKVTRNSLTASRHHQMLQSYALKDYLGLIDLLDIKPNDIVFDAAGGTGALSKLVAKKYPEAKVILGDLEEVIHLTDVKDKCKFNLFTTWPVSANKIILSRVLHDWDDEDAVTILREASRALRPNGEIYVIEMLLPKSGYDGSLCDLHLLCVTGGKERTYLQYKTLISDSGLKISTTLTNNSLVSVLCLTHKKTTNE